jgi:hypothetical protein
MLEHKKKGRLCCHKRPKSREETPKEGSDSGVGLGRYRIPLAKTIAIGGSVERRDHGPTRKFMAFALKAEHFRNGSFADMPGPRRHVRFTAESGHQSQRPTRPLRAMNRHVATISLAQRQLKAPRPAGSPADVTTCELDRDRKKRATEVKPAPRATPPEAG